MSLRTPHGDAATTGAIAPRLETLPADELPVGVPAVPVDERPGNRGPGGRFAAGNASAKRGGLAKAHHRRLAAQLGAVDLPPSSELGPYRRWAVEWRDATASDMARTCGGGHVGPLPGSLLDSAALALMWSRYLSDIAMRSGEPDAALRASKFAEISSRLAREAWEYAAREAAARQDDDSDELRAAQRAFQARLASGSA